VGWSKSKRIASRQVTNGLTKVKNLITTIAVIAILAAATAMVCGLAQYELNPSEETNYEIEK